MDADSHAIINQTDTETVPSGKTIFHLGNNLKSINT